MIVKDSIKAGQKPTKEQINMIKEAAKKPIEFDSESPELSDAQIKSLECAVRQRNRFKKAN